jgi:hypothetical protein
MRLIIAALLALMFGTFEASEANSACRKGDPKLAGAYELQNIREVGSLIYLAADGRFGYMMTFGAVDEVAEGCWTGSRSRITLRPTRMQVTRGGRKFRRLSLTRLNNGSLERRFYDGSKAVYAKVE